jgi:aspartyl-tRNA(Asn)/glutamyl-tRNA(Gln) amidotransferase subunit C
MFSFTLWGIMVDMTQISKGDVQHLAQLSSLQLDDDEIDGLQTDIGNILDYINQLSELDTSGVEPTYQVTDLKNIWRADIVDDYGIDRDDLIALAPDSEQGQIKVPKVL